MIPESERYRTKWEISTPDNKHVYIQFDNAIEAFDTIRATGIPVESHFLCFDGTKLDHTDIFILMCIKSSRNG